MKNENKIVIQPQVFMKRESLTKYEPSIQEINICFIKM